MKKSLILLTYLVFVTGCSTIFNSGSQSLIVKSSNDREGVMVEITTPDGSYRTKLPTTVVTTPSSFVDTRIDVVDKCFVPVSYRVNKSITPSFFANILWGFGIFIAAPIDYLDGYMWKLNKMAIVPLTPSGKC